MAVAKVSAPLVSHTGVPLTRAVAFRFALDPTRAQEQLLLAHAGASRLAFNHHLARVKANLAQRAAERSYRLEDDALTPSLSWSRVSFINEMNAWKNGYLPTSPTAADGTQGLQWRGEVSADVFETASVDAAQALANWSDSRKGARKDKAVAFPRFKSRHTTAPAFRIRSKCTPGQSAPVRVAGPKALRLGKLGVLRIHGCTRRVRRMLEQGRLHLFAASIRREHERWWVSLQGVAAVCHTARRSSKGRHTVQAGMDRGVKSLAVVANAEGVVLRTVEGVNALKHAQVALRRANKAYSRTKIGSVGRRKAAARLGRIHARVANLRRNTAHQLSYWAATTLTTLTVEDLNVAGMTQLRTLARSISDAGMGDLGRMLSYKAGWYGLEIHQADRWFPSSKTCSACGSINTDLTLADRVYRCPCGLVLGRDVNAAINLARWPELSTASPPRPAAA